MDKALEMKRKKRLADMFTNHMSQRKVYTEPTGVLIDFLRFTALDTTSFRIDYLLKDGRLFVSGDLGAAIYEWNSAITLEEISRMDLEYFAEKCTASEYGRGYIQWDGDAGVTKLAAFANNLAERVVEKVALADDETVSGQPFTGVVVMDKVENLGGLEALRESREAWYSFLSRFGSVTLSMGSHDDSWQGLSRVGEVIAFRCEAHLEGLGLALERRVLPNGGKPTS